MPDELEDLVATLRTAGLCWRCLVLKTGLAPEAIDRAFSALQGGAAIRRHLGPCDSCQRDTLVYRIA